MYENSYIRRRKMSYIKGIFERATIRGIADYLLFGLGPDEDNRGYEERLEEPYMRFEKAVAKYDKNPNSELLELSNEITSETASVYTEIGLQVGMLLMKDMIKNISIKKETPIPDFENGKDEFNANATLLEGMYKERVESALEEVLQKDERYQKISKETRRKIEEIDKLGLGKEEWLIIDRALSATNERCAEYGRVSYRQGFLDAVRLLKR
ncbi:hypothetical protein [Merdimonas faecis]|uniref:hypothetical protein n=1 Tax=Merdimonas faecis TaxID=1653435 RepID=UPI0022E5FC4A|nr:hypothetical protein [Merdimonas faecis]